MNQTPDNVTPLNAPDNSTIPSVEEGVSKGGNMDLAKIAIVVSLLSVVLSVIFFFGLNRNLSGLSNEVKDIGVIRTNVEALDSYVDDILTQMGRVNTRIMELEEKPRKEAVRVLQESMIDDMLRRAEFMGGQLAEVAPEDTDTAAKLERLKAVLQEFSVQNVTGAKEEQQDASALPAATDIAPTTVPEQAVSVEAAPAPVLELLPQITPLDESSESVVDVPEVGQTVQPNPAPIEEPAQLIPAPAEHQLVPAPEPMQ